MVSQQFSRMPVADLVHALSAETSTPGGGTCSALTGAVAASLVCMVCRYTLGREKYRASEALIRSALARAEELRDLLTEQMDADAAAYAGYERARLLPKGTPEEARARAEELQSALARSSEVPLRVAECALDVLSLAADAARHGNVNLLADAAIAAHLAAATITTAAVNVRLNSRGIRDEGARRRLEERMRRVETSHAVALAACLASVEERTAP